MFSAGPFVHAIIVLSGCVLADEQTQRKPERVEYRGRAVPLFGAIDPSVVGGEAETDALCDPNVQTATQRQRETRLTGSS